MLKITVPKIKNFLFNVTGSGRYSDRYLLCYPKIISNTQEQVISAIGFDSFCRSWNMPIAKCDRYNVITSTTAYYWQGLIVPYLMTIADNDQIIQALNAAIDKANNSRKLFNILNIFIKSPIFSHNQFPNFMYDSIITKNIIDRIDIDRINDICTRVIQIFINQLNNSYKQDYYAIFMDLSKIPIEYFPHDIKNILINRLLKITDNISLDIQYQCFYHILQLSGNIDDISRDKLKNHLKKIFNKRTEFNGQLKMLELLKFLLTSEEFKEYDKRAAHKFIYYLGEI